jgi:hypothetical protein
MWMLYNEGQQHKLFHTCYDLVQSYILLTNWDFRGIRYLNVHDCKYGFTKDTCNITVEDISQIEISSSR